MADDLQNMSAQEILELQKKNCIFCKIISKEIPSHEIYSDDKVMVILDINPANEGHCLILPREHYQILPQIPDGLIRYMFKIAKRTSRSLLKSLGMKGTSVFVANGALAGQKAPHFMIHAVPRRPGDMLFQIPKNNIDEKELEDVRNKVAMAQPGPEPKEKKEQKEGPAEKQPGKEEQGGKEQKDVDLDDIANLFLDDKK